MKLSKSISGSVFTIEPDEAGYTIYDSLRVNIGHLETIEEVEIICMERTKRKFEILGRIEQDLIDEASKFGWKRVK